METDTRNVPSIINLGIVRSWAAFSRGNNNHLSLIADRLGSIPSRRGAQQKLLPLQEIELGSPSPSALTSVLSGIKVDTEARSIASEVLADPVSLTASIVDVAAQRALNFNGGNDHRAISTACSQKPMNAFAKPLAADSKETLSSS
jgi:hypothetical protein